MFFAEKNNGAFFNNHRIRVSSKNDMNDCFSHPMSALCFVFVIVYFYLYLYESPDRNQNNDSYNKSNRTLI